MEFYKIILNICNEALDLSIESVDLHVHKGCVIFQSKSCGYAIRVIPVDTNEYQGAPGLHRYFSDSFDEYELSDLLEMACNRGHDNIYIHQNEVA